MESPYQPPREVDPSDDSSMHLHPGVFQFTADQQRMVGRLGKYLSDIGGLLIFLSVISLVAMVVSGALLVSATGFEVMGVVQLVQQVVNVGFFFAIGWWMRKAASSLKAVSQSPDEHLDKLMMSMATLRSTYGIKAVFMAVGIAFSLVVLSI